MSYMLDAQRNQRHDRVVRSQYHTTDESQVWYSMPLLYAICKYVPKTPKFTIKKK